jgi:hypothetical protein
MADNQPHPRLSVEEMQRRFNEGGYWDKLKAGELKEVKVEYHPDTIYPEVIERHPGAVSVTAWWQDENGNDIVQVHYFKLPTWIT